MARSIMAGRTGYAQQRVPHPGRTEAPNPVLLGASCHSAGCKNMRKEQDFSQIPGAVPSSCGLREGAGGQGSHGRLAAGLMGIPGPWGADGLGAGMRRHAQVRRATYTYGVIPQDVQLLHQLRDQDVLEAKTGIPGGECQPGEVVQGAGVGGGGLPSLLQLRSRPGGGSSLLRRGCGGS